jgi:serine/threonine-protein kinase
MDPQRIGPYEIERKIGAGGMGTVYLGRHEETGQQAAVKVLPPMLAREAGFLARFNREIDALRQLHHPQVVELYESGTDGETYYYAMEYVEGQTLMERLKAEKRIGWREVITLSIQVCGALKAAHNAGIVHRDLKPSNLLLTSDGGIKLTDFGVAQVFAASRLTVTDGVIGTAEYMSPEQAAGKRAEKRSDIYSLGAVMYVMLTGRPPFTGKTAIDIGRKHLTSRFDSPRMIIPELPYWLDEVVCQCLEKKPEDRYPDAYVLARRLEEIPKKVELAARDHTVEFEGASATAVTVATGEGEGKGQGDPQVGATLMRDLVKSQLEQQTQPETPVGRALDNTWILIALLALVVTGGVLWRKNVNRDSFAVTQDPLLAVKRSEAKRFTDRANHQWKSGETDQALQTLNALMTVLPDSEEFVKQRAEAQELIRQIEAAQPEDGYPLLKSSLENAESLRQDGQIDDARSIWLSLLSLYDDADPAAVDGLAEARRRLAETEPDSNTDH